MTLHQASSDATSPPVPPRTPLQSVPTLFDIEHRLEQAGIAFNDGDLYPALYGKSQGWHSFCVESWGGEWVADAIDGAGFDVLGTDIEWRPDQRDYKTIVVFRTRDLEFAGGQQVLITGGSYAGCSGNIDDITVYDYHDDCYDVFLADSDGLCVGIPPHHLQAIDPTDDDAPEPVQGGDEPPQPTPRPIKPKLPQPTRPQPAPQRPALPQPQRPEPEPIVPNPQPVKAYAHEGDYDYLKVAFEEPRYWLTITNFNDPVVRAEYEAWLDSLNDAIGF